MSFSPKQVLQCRKPIRIHDNIICCDLLLLFIMVNALAIPVHVFEDGEATVLLVQFVKVIKDSKAKA